MNKVELKFKAMTRPVMERADALFSGVKGVSRVDVWEDRALIAFQDIETLDRVMAALRELGPDGGELIDGSVTAEIGGMSCRSCEITIERHVGKIPAACKVTADAGRGRVKLQFSPQGLPDAASIDGAIREAGYRLGDLGSDVSHRAKFSVPELFGFLAAAFGVAWLISAFNLSKFAFTADGGLNFGAAVVLGLLAGFSSCMAVSGGLMLAVVTRLEGRFGKSSFGRMTPSLLFIVGRLASYSLLGAAIGWLGRLVTPSASLNGAIIMAAALIMLLAGLDSLGLLPTSLRRFVPTMPKRFGKSAAGLAESGSIVAPLALGAATFFLPCGFTQSLQLYALTVKSPLAGAAVLGGFALGTVPALAAVGWAAGWLKGRAKRIFLGISGAVLVALAAVNLFSGMTVLGLVLPWHASATAAESEKAVLPPVSDGYQLIRMTVGSEAGAYYPDSFTVKAGMPVRWEIDQRTSTGCLSYVVSRGLSINEPLKLGSNVVEFTPQKPGKYVFSCSMGMYTGTITVLPAS